MKILSVFVLLLLSISSGAQCPPTFDSNTDVCVSENVDFTNVTSGQSYQWDFCAGDIEEGFNSTSLLTNSSFNRNRTIKVIKDNEKWYAFSINQSSSNLQRIELGNDLSNPTANYINLGTFSGQFNRPYDIDLIYDGLWHAFVPNLNAGTIVRLDFNDGIDQPPTFNDLGNFSGVIEAPNHVLIVEDGGDYFVLVSDGQNLVKLSFGSDITSTPTSDLYNIIGSNTLRGFDLIKDCDSWVGIVLSYSSNEFYSVDFGSSLDNIPAFNALVTSSTIRFPANIEIINEDAKYYGFVQGAQGEFYQIDFGSSVADFSFTDQELTDAVFTDNNNFALDIVTDSSKWYGFNFNLDSRELVQLSFVDDCSASIAVSSDQSPSDVSYATGGNYSISSRVETNSGEVGYSSNVITVSSDVAPSASFSIDPSRCISNANTFTPSISGLTSYSWDFNGDGVVDVSETTGADQPFDYSIAGGGPGAGSYTVRLDVSDGTCTNFYEEQITIYDPPPAPSYDYTSAQTCINADFTFTNTTSDGGYEGPLAYLWEFIDEPSGTVVATANTPDAVYAFETAGEKTVRLTSSIPGCTEETEQTLLITPGPTADFFAASVCQGEAMQFTNTSEEADSYSWDFSDGFMSSATNPSHIFTDAGNYFVTLTAIDSEGCEDTEVVEVAVSNSPQISFDFDIPCTSSEGIQFFDLTTVDNADLVSWAWYVEDEEVSTSQSPQITFESTGVKNIRLDVQSSNGCESSYSEDIEVLTSPAPDFSIDAGCQGETSTFADITSSSGNPVVSWLWTINGENYTTQDANHTFNDAGIFDVTLEVTGQNFCSETITKSVEIIELPTVDFSVDGECDNQLIRVQDQSTDSSDPVIARRWMLNGSNVGNGSQLILDNLEDNTYDLALELETATGCIISSSQLLQINDAPESSFTSSRTYGVPGDDEELTFTNTSIGGINYQWLLNGELRSENPTSESISFSSAGMYEVSLVAQNSLGCNDTTTQEILIAIPEVDLAIGSFELVRENNTGRIFLEVQNFSNLPIEVTEAQIILENQFTLSEQILKFIDIGESSLISLNVGIPLTASEPTYFCVKLVSQYAGYPDVQPLNNEKCITIDPVIKLEDPFPNPVTDQFRLKLIVDEASTATISLINSAGKIQINQLRDVSSGLNNFFIDMSTLDPGIYFVMVELSGTTHKRKVIKL